MKYIKKVLENGMTIVLVPMKNVQLVSMGFFVNAGSRDEASENNGIAHFLEHMMFKGTSKRSAEDLFRELDTIGTTYNAATSTQYTYYYVLGNMSHTKKILDIVLDIYLRPDFKTKEINPEKKVIIEEMRLRSDMPFAKLYNVMHRKIFRGTSLERTIIGVEDTVMNFGKADLKDFRLKMYTPQNTVFVMAGNFSPGPIFDMVKKVLNSVENVSPTCHCYTLESTQILDQMQKQDQPYVFIKQNMMFQQVYLLLAFPIYDLYQSHDMAIDLLSQLLSTGFSGRLNSALREKKGITYNLATYPIVYSDAGIFAIQMVLNPVELVPGIKITLRELKRIKNKPISNDEMKKIKNVTKNNVLYSMTKPLEILTYFGINFLIDRNFKPDLVRNFQRLKKVTKGEILKISREIFIRDKINLFLYGNVTETNFDFMSL